ncbi:MAG: anthranilate synthase component I [Deltaproteobacteria bacterium RBG_16_48_10]|nr:MAG: anthranilate synthase component I [Deltaproteobacteria bacterium RBG_16_48_10]
MAIPSLEDFKRMAGQGNLIPVFEEVHFDWETPISAFRKIDEGHFSFLLESAEGGEKWGRYSFLGSTPSYILRSKGDVFEILKDGEVLRTGKERDPLHVLEDFLSHYKPVAYDSLPRFFGGAVGYANYDLIRSFERLPELHSFDLDFFDCYFMVTDTLLVFDNVKHKIKVFANVFLDDHRPLEEVYQEAEEKIRRIVARLQRDLPFSSIPKSFPPSSLSSNLSKKNFLEMVERTKGYIQAGDAIQVVLSQRFTSDLHCEPFDVYRALRSVNPSPYLFYLKMNDTVLLGASPEVMVRLEEGQMELRPLAGTRRRGTTEEEDLVMERELLADEKEKAEHIMLVDLGRNDLSRVAETGSVKVTELMKVERYSHVMHIVSNIQGTLGPQKNAYDVFRATFPAGTVSGAPKVRAMEIIEELEPIRRGPYAGAVGYFSFTGNLDTCITIRSILIKAGKAYVQVGAGIVADSEPEKEYDETLNKAQAIFNAIRLAEEGLR